MPGTPLPARRSRKSTGALRSITNKENTLPQDELASPGDIMSKEKLQRASRVNRRISVLKILGRTEAEISPCAEPDQAAADAGAKRRRTSRVSFGNIQTAIYQKDSEWNNTPSPAAPNAANQGNNLSSVPDDSGFASPAATEQSCVDMSLTGGFTNRMQPLSSLPPVDDMFQNDTSLASFGEPETSPTPRDGAGGFAVSLADLVAEDEREWEDRNQQSGGSGRNEGMEFRSANADMDKMVDGEAAAAAQKPADMTDHSLTRDIPAPGNRTRALADHTGAFLALSRRGSDVTGAGMELTNAYGGIVHVARPEGEEGQDEGGMEFTAAYGGIVAERGAGVGVGVGARGNTSAELMELTGTLSRIRQAEEVGGGEAAGEGVAMEMTGTFGRILSAISSDPAADQQQAEAEGEEEERTDPLAVSLEQRTYVDGEVTMFTPLSRLKRRASASAPRPRDQPAPVPSPEPLAPAAAPAGSPEASPPLAMRTRSRSRTPTRGGSEEPAEGGRRRSGAKRGKGRGAEGERAVALEAFLEEMGIRFLTSARAHTRKSSACPPPRSPDPADVPTAARLREVLVTCTELGQLRNNGSRLRDMAGALTAEVAAREARVSSCNPAVVREGMGADAERAVAVQAAMKALKKRCRVASEIRWTQWRDAAQREVEEALGRVKAAVAEDLVTLQERMAAAAAARREETQLRADNKKGELSEQLARLQDAESEQALMIHTFTSQLEALHTLRESLSEQLVERRQPAPLPLDDTMLPVIADAAPPVDAVPELSRQHQALQALAAAVPLQLSPGAVSFKLPGNRSLKVLMSPSGTVTSAVLHDHAPAPRRELERALFEGAGAKALVDGLVYPRGMPGSAVGGVVEELSLRCRRVAALCGELAALGRRHFVREGGGAEPQVEVVAHNPAKAYKVAVTFQLAWHYPAGRLPYSAAVVFGEVEENLVADAALRHCSGPRRISNIVSDVCSA